MLHKNLGFELLDMINYESQVIFISGFKDFALDSFKYDPVDYLLKPFGIKPLKEAVNRAVSRITEKEGVSKTEDRDYITVSTGKKIQIIKLKDIMFCENYVNQKRSEEHG